MAERETVRITPYRDGPLLVRGPARLLTADGNELEPRRRTVALCRCGKSRLRPFCDGTHKQIGFRAPSGETIELPGGAVTLRVDLVAGAQTSARSTAGAGSAPSA